MSDISTLDEDAGGVLVELVGNIRLTLGGMLEAAKKLAATADAQARAVEAGLLLPQVTRVSGGGTYLSTGPLVIDLGGPAQGSVWELRNLVVGGLTVATTAAGVADLYISGAPASSMPGSILEWRDEAISLPLNSFYGAGDITARYPERVLVVITGGTADQDYLAALSIVNRLDSPTNRGSTEL